MEFREDAGVFTAEDERVGHLDRVVLDPASKEVTHIVARKGFLFSEDKVIPVNLIASATEERITLREAAGDLQALPNFVREHYVVVDEQEIARPDRPTTYPYPSYWVPPLAGAPYGLPLARPVLAEESKIRQLERNIPEQAVPLKQGARVIASDDEHVGDIEEILTEPESDQVSHIVVARGVLSKERRLIPISWVRRIGETKVFLFVGSGTVEQLPEYSG